MNFVKVPPDPLQSTKHSESLSDKSHLTLFPVTYTVEESENSETMSEVNPKSESTARGRRKSSAKLSRARKANLVAPEQIQEVFDFWCATLRPTARRRPILDDKRREYIGAAIHDFNVQLCLQAIEGCSYSDFHMGRNKANKRYDSIELIFRDAEHIERFLELHAFMANPDGEPF